MAKYAPPISNAAEELIKLARQSMQHGNKQQAQQYLEQAVQLDPENFMIWLWLAGAASNAKTSLDYIQQAEQLNPKDPRVEEARRWAEKRLRKENKDDHLIPAEAVTEEKKKRNLSSAVVLGSLIIVFVILAVIAAVLFTSGQNSAVAGPPIPPLNENLAVIPDEQQFVPELAAASNIPAEPTSTPKPFVPAKDLAAQSADKPRPTWTVTPTPTNTPTPTPTWVPTFVSNGGKEYLTRPFGVDADEKWIDVDLSEQTLTAYIGNEAVFSTLISSGLSDHPTVTGQFRIWLAYESQTMDGRLLGYDYYLENVPYVMYFYNDYALHGTYWHNNFGTPMSHGCVNMDTADAGWIYSWASIGTLVNVHN